MISQPIPVRTRTTPMASTIFFFVILLLALVSGPNYSVDAARRRPSSTSRGPASGRVDPSKYDRSITTFSSDGRLLQVEYGAIAAARGATVACLDLDCISLAGDATSRRSRRGVVVAVVRQQGRAGGSTSTSQLSDKVHRIDDNVILVTSGLSGDSRALASSARMACQRMHLSYGEAPSLAEVANLVGSTQHQLTRMGGARPFGVSAAVIGVNPIPDEEVGGEINNDEEGDPPPPPGVPALFRTEPGGAVDRCDYCAVGKGAEKAITALESATKDLVPENNENDEEQAEHDERPILVNVIRKVALAALDADGEPYVSNLKQDDGKKQQNGNKKAETSVDIWLVEACPKGRGGTKFRVARAVKRRNLDEAARCLLGSDVAKVERQ